MFLEQRQQWRDNSVGTLQMGRGWSCRRSMLSRRGGSHHLLLVQMWFQKWSLYFPGCRKGWGWKEREKQEKTGSWRWVRRKRRDFCQGKRVGLMARVTGIMGVRGIVWLIKCFIFRCYDSTLQMRQLRKKFQNHLFYSLLFTTHRITWIWWRGNVRAKCLRSSWPPRVSWGMVLYRSCLV